MFKVEDSNQDMTKCTRVRPFNFGWENLGNAERHFIWEEEINSFLEITGDSIDGYIQDCLEDDKTHEDVDTPYLYELNYPSAHKLLKNHSNYFFELILYYPELAIHPFFDIPYIGTQEITSGFAINNLDKIYLKEDKIIFEGRGYYFPINKD